jgi:hypothetical protein
MVIIIILFFSFRFAIVVGAGDFFLRLKFTSWPRERLTKIIALAQFIILV